MSQFYDKSAATGLRLISKYGQPLTVRRRAKSFDPVASDVSAPVDTDAVFQMVVVPFATKRELDDRLLELLRKGKLRKLIASAMSTPAGFVPAGADWLLGLEGRNWLISQVGPLNPAGTALLYTIYAEESVMEP